MRSTIYCRIAFLCCFVGLNIGPATPSLDAQDDPVQGFLRQVRSGNQNVTLPENLEDALARLRIGTNEMGFAVYRQQNGRYDIPIVEGGGTGVDVYQYEYDPDYIDAEYQGIIAHTHPPDAGFLYKAQIFSAGPGFTGTTGGDISLFLLSREIVSILKTDSGTFMLVKPTGWVKPPPERTNEITSYYASGVRGLAGLIPHQRRDRERLVLKTLAMRLRVNLYFREPHQSSFKRLVPGT